MARRKKADEKPEQPEVTVHDRDPLGGGHNEVPAPRRRKAGEADE